jgi:hypothetical protein
MFERMKDGLAKAIDDGQIYMFDDASRILLEKLKQMKVSCRK